ncbi:MAG: diacylglycerol kinase family lipid kinase [Cyclobacteriaceae bacterium]|nr:diacylglycerol kinase family lipid kinase [Cyclobacteriaceae bacterium]
MSDVKKVVIILNGISLRKNYFYSKILPALQTVVHVTVQETRSKNDAVLLASKAVSQSFDAILAAGGDGTLNQVLNGVLHEQSNNLPVLGLVPLGSGNDFARTVNVRSDIEFLKNLFTDFTFRPVDVGKISFPDSKEPARYFINIADVGMGPYVVQRLLNSDRLFGSLAAYYVAIIKTFFTYRPFVLKMTTPLWKWSGMIRSVAIANGKFFGNGIGIAPVAKPDDGLFSCFIAGKISVIDFILQNGRLRKGKRPIHNEIQYRETDSVMLEADEAQPIEADGELAGNLPVRIELLPKKIGFLMPVEGK